MILKNFALKFCGKFLYIAAHSLSMFIQLLRPFLGPDSVCPFTIGCTQYAIMQLEEFPLSIAIPRIAKRLIMCNPFTNLLQKNCSRHKAMSETLQDL